MPDFDGTGPLKRGRVIGRGLGPCKKSAGVCSRKDAEQGVRLCEQTACTISPTGR
jgi:hypothetical protein